MYKSVHIVMGCFLIVFSTCIIETAWSDTSRDVYPVILALEGQGGVLIGGTVKGHWVAEKQIAKELSGGEMYKQYSKHKYLDETNGSKSGIRDQYLFWVDFASKHEDCFIAIAGDWDAMPRKEKSQSTKQKAYLQAVHKVLVENGLPDAPVNITQVFSIDLEGDRQDEVLITAKSPEYDPGIWKQGQYSLVMLRKIIKGQVKTFLLSSEFHVSKIPPGNLLLEPEYDINEDGIPDGFPEFYEITGFWDLDGDGTLEIGTAWSSFRRDAVGYKFHKWNGKEMNILLLTDGGFYY